MKTIFLPLQERHDGLTAASAFSLPRHQGERRADDDRASDADRLFIVHSVLPRASLSVANAAVVLHELVACSHLTTSPEMAVPVSLHSDTPLPAHKMPVFSVVDSRDPCKPRCEPFAYAVLAHLAAPPRLRASWRVEHHLSLRGVDHRSRSSPDDPG
jgi:hypothetical protein